MKIKKPSLRRLVRKLPPIVKRDRIIAELKRDLKQTKTIKQDVSPSIFHEINRAVRQRPHYILDDDWDAFAGFALNKSGVRQLAERLRLNLPQIYGTWNSLDDIPWETLPEAIVVKSNSGSTSNGVLPLIRQGNQWRIANRETPAGLEELLSPLKKHLEEKRIKPPFHIEQFLGTRPGYEIPPDVKIFTFYGQPTLMFVRKVSDHYEDSTDHRVRYFNVYGDEVTNINVVQQQDSSIPRPENFDELMRIAAEVSLATRLPHVRVDLYDINGTPFFGEITPRPGPLQFHSLGQPWDHYLGECFEAAETRINIDIVRGFINASGPVVRTGQTPINETLLTPPSN